MRSGGATYRSIAAPAEPGRLKEMLAAGAGQAARSKFRVQRGQDLVGHRHAADDHTRSTLPVVVGASGHQKPVEERVSPVALDRGGVVLRMPDLDPVEAAAGPGGNQVVAVQGPRVGQDRDPTRLAHDRGRLLERALQFRYVRWSVMTEIALERLVEALHVPRAQERLGDVGPAERASTRDLHHLLERDPDPEPLQAREDLPRALAPPLAVAADRRGQRGIGFVESVDR